MKKTLLIGAALLLGVIVLVSNSNGQDKERSKKKKSKSTTITINDGDTIVNGKKYSDLSKEEKAEFEKMQAKFEKEMNFKSIELDKKMKALDKEMKALNREMVIIGDSFDEEINIGEDGDKVIIRSRNAPRAPRAPHAPRHAEFPEIPPVPELPHFNFDFDGEHGFVFSNGDDANAQVFIFNNDGKKTVIKMLNANADELKKIGAKTNEEISLYPNPAKDQLTLSFNFSESSPVSITIYDMEGKIIKTENIKDYKAGNYEKVYSISEFENGSYLVEFAQKDKKIVRKIIIRK